jgi:hypothetical protein
MKAAEKASAPTHLQPLTQSWWESVVRRWQLEEHHVRLLTLAAEAWDRGQEARPQVEQGGLMVPTKAGGPRLHPCVKVKEQAEIAFACLIRELDLGLGRASDHGSACPAAESAVSRKIRVPKQQIDALPSPAWTFWLLAGRDPECRLPGLVTFYQAGMFGEATAERSKNGTGTP